MELQSNYLISYPAYGLGNNLFIIASTYGLSRKFNRKFAIIRNPKSIHANID